MTIRLLATIRTMVELDLLAGHSNAMCDAVTSTNHYEGAGLGGTSDRHPGDMMIGFDAIAGEPEMCIMAIGLGQLIGRCVGRDKRTGRFVSLTKRLVVCAYTDVEPVELERRPNPRKAPAVAARLVVGLALVVITATVAGVTIAAALLAAAAKVARSAVEYVNREFIQQWRLLALVLVPCGAFLAWVATR